MEYGIQRGTILLAPPDGQERLWITGLYDRDEVWRNFGLPGPASSLFERRVQAGNVISGIAHSVPGGRRLGFMNVFPPKEQTSAWEFAFVIVEPRDRNAFNAIAIADITAHYLFDHLALPRVACRIRSDNRASLAVVRRLGYAKYGSWEVEGDRFDFFSITPEKWRARRERFGLDFTSVEERPSAPALVGPR